MKAAVLLAACLTGSLAMKGDIQYTIEAGDFVRWYAFGAQTGAEFQQTITITSASPAPGVVQSDIYFWGIVADSSQFSDLISLGNDGICDQGTDLSQFAFASSRLGYSANSSSALSTTWNLDVPVSTADYYSFLVVSCAYNWDFDVDLAYHMINPGGEELSSTRIPMKSMTLGFLFTWGVLAALMAANMLAVRWAWQRWYYDATLAELAVAAGLPPSSAVLSPVRWLHIALLTVPLLSMGRVGLSRAFYTEASWSGEYNMTIGYLSVGAGAVVVGTMVSIMLALSLGWQITRPHLEKPEIRQVLIVGSLYAVVTACFDLIGGFLFLFMTILVFVLVLRYVFSSVTWRLRVLSQFASYVSGVLSPAAQPTTTVASVSVGSGSLPVNTTSTTPAQPSSAPSSSAPTTIMTAGAVPATVVPVSSGSGGVGSHGEGASLMPPAAAHIPIAPSLPAYAAAASSPSSLSGGRHGGNGYSDEGDGDDEESEQASLMQARSSSAAANGLRAPVPFASFSSTSSPGAGTSGARIPSSAAAAGAAGGASGATGGVYAARSWSDWLPWTMGGRRRQAALNANLTTRQMDTLKYFRSAIVGYLTVGMMVELWSALSLVDLPWVSFLMEQLLNACMLTYLYTLFRARADPHRGVLFDPTGYANNGASDSLMDGYGSGAGGEGVINAGAFGAVDDQDAHHQGSGGTHALSSSSRVLVIQNPDVIDASGNAVPSVAIAEIVPEGTHSASGASGNYSARPAPLSVGGPGYSGSGVTRAVRSSMPPAATNAS